MRNPRLDDPDTPDRPFTREYLFSGDKGPFLGKTDEAIPSDDTGTVNIYTGPLGSEAATGETVECYNRGEEIATETWVNYIPRGGGYECFPLECNP